MAARASLPPLLLRAEVLGRQSSRGMDDDVAVQEIVEGVEVPCVTGGQSAHDHGGGLFHPSFSPRVLARAGLTATVDLGSRSALP